MRDVYWQAKEVLIWLGEEEPTDGDTFNLVHDVYYCFAEHERARPVSERGYSTHLP